MPIYSLKQKALFLRHTRNKVAAILMVERSEIDQAESHARAYALGLYDVAAITQADCLTLLAEARQSAVARVNEFGATAADVHPLAEVIAAPYQALKA